jgi:glycosyltransferase involved in cell wall biosynthesis
VLGIIARADLGSGLQAQTLALTKMLKPDRIMLVNSAPFNGATQVPEMYDGFTVQPTQGWPTNLECARFMSGLSHVLTAETAYNPKIYDLARLNGAKVFTQLNWEFLDHLVNPNQPKPYKWLMPSHWHLEEMVKLFPNTVYLPPPVIMGDFQDARDTNLARSGSRRLLHVVGKVASHDRNGTFDVIDALSHSTGQFELVIKSQYEIPQYANLVSDSRVSFVIGNDPDQSALFKDFDALIMPRRYGGLCLPMNEALASGIPVIMTDISPNNQVLPKDWLVPAQVTGSSMARTTIDVHKSDFVELAKKLDWLSLLSDEDLLKLKMDAYEVAMERFSSDSLKLKYNQELEL